MKLSSEIRIDNRVSAHEVSLRPRIARVVENLSKLTGIESKDLGVLVSQRRFDTYRSISNRVNNVLAISGAQFDSQALPIVDLFSIWLKVVDDKIDNEKVDGEIYLQILKGVNPPSTTDSTSLDFQLTKSLAQALKDNQPALQAIEGLYRADQNYRNSQTDAELLKNKIIVGELAADAISEIIHPQVSSSFEKFKELFKQIGGLGNLIDLLKDWNEDTLRLKITNHHANKVRLRALGLISASIFRIMSKNPKMGLVFGESLFRQLRKTVGTRIKLTIEKTTLN